MTDILKVMSAWYAYKEGRVEDFEREIKEMFDEMDANKNGEVDKEEVRKSMEIF